MMLLYEFVLPDAVAHTADLGTLKRLAVREIHVQTDVLWKSVLHDAPCNDLYHSLRGAEVRIGRIVA